MLQDIYQRTCVYIKNIIFQLNAKKGWLKEMDLDQIYLVPGLVLEMVEDSQGLLFLIHTEKEWKRLKKTRKQK